MARKSKEPKTEEFRLSLVDDKTHRQLWVFRFTRDNLFITIITILFVFFAITASLIAFTPLKTFIPGYPDARTKQEAIQNIIRIDSLESVVSRWELYSENLRRIVDGQQPIKLDSALKAWDKVPVRERNAGDIAEKDSILRATVQKEKQFQISGNAQRTLPIEGMHFFVPVKGVVSQGFDPVTHPYLDITAAANSMVMSVLDGTVVFSGWDEQSGYTLQIQHTNDIISTYKHNQSLLRKTGEKVSAGTPVAIVGNTGKTTAGDHLHFELWYKGNAVDPTKYISF